MTDEELDSLPVVGEESSPVSGRANEGGQISAEELDALPVIGEEGGQISAEELDALPVIGEEGGQISAEELDALPVVEDEGGQISAEELDALPIVGNEQHPKQPIEQKQTQPPAEQQPDTHWQEMDERARQFNLGDKIYGALSAAGKAIGKGLDAIEHGKQRLEGMLFPAGSLQSEMAASGGTVAGKMLKSTANVGANAVEAVGNLFGQDWLRQFAEKTRQFLDEKIDTDFEPLVTGDPEWDDRLNKLSEGGSDIMAALFAYSVPHAATIDIAASSVNTFFKDLRDGLSKGMSFNKASSMALVDAGLEGAKGATLKRLLKGAKGPGQLMDKLVEELLTALKFGGIDFGQDIVKQGFEGADNPDLTRAKEVGQEGFAHAAAFQAAAGAARKVAGAVFDKGAASKGAGVEDLEAERERARQEQQAAENRAKFTPEQESTLNMRIPEFVGDDAEMTLRVRDRIAAKMKDEAFGGTPEGKSPLRERLDDPAEMEVEIEKAAEEILVGDNVSEIAKSVNTQSLGTKAALRTEQIAGAMPRSADKAESRIAGEIAAADPELAPERVWEVAEYLAAHEDAARQDGKPLTKERIAEIEKEMAGDEAGTVPVEQPDGTFKTVGEVEADAAKEQRKGQPASTKPQGGTTQVDHSGDWTPVDGKDGVWHTAEFPEVEIAIKDTRIGDKPGESPEKALFIDNLPDPATLDEAGQMKLGKFLVEQREKAERLGINAINLGKTPEEAAKYAELAERYDQKVNGEKFKARADGVLDVLKKSGLASEVVATEEEFNAKLEQEGYAMQAKDGRTYGFTDGKNVYLNPAFFGSREGVGTSIHEFGHLGVIATKKINRPLYDRGVELARQTGLFKEIGEHPDYAEIPEQRRAEEVLVRIIEERGANIEANTPKSVVDEIKKWIVEFWKALGNKIGIRDLTPERIERMTIEDVADAIRAEMMSGREFGTRELSIQEGDLKAKILRLAKYQKPTSKSAKAALDAAKKAWKGLNEEQKAALGQYGDTSVLKTPEARTIANGIRTLREWDARRERISQRVKEQIRRSPNEAQKKIITGSPKYYVSEVTGDVTSPFAYAIDKGLPIPRKGDWGWDAWERLTDGMKYKERRALEKILGGEHPKRGGMDTVLSDYAQWLGVSWDEGARDFEHGRGIEDFLDDILKEREKFESWRRGDRKTRAEDEADAAAARERQGGMTDAEFAEEDAWVRAAEARRVERERMGEQDDYDEAIPFSRPLQFSRAGKRTVGYTAPDGSAKPGYLKAPNGNDSRLDERQWNEVRTESYGKWFGDWQSKIRRDKLDAIKPMKVRVGAISARDGLSAAAAAKRWFAKNVGSAEYNTEVGKVVIDGRSIHDSLAHKYSQAKLDAVTTLKDGFATAVYIGSGKDIDGKPLMNHYFAYPIQYGSERRIVFCRAREDAQKNRLYLHEVFVEKNLSDSLQTAALPEGRTLRGGIALMKSILNRIYTVKGEEGAANLLCEKSKFPACILRTHIL